MQIPLITNWSNFSSGSLRKSFYFHFLDEYFLNGHCISRAETWWGWVSSGIGWAVEKKLSDGGQSFATFVIYPLHWHVLLHFQKDSETHLIPFSSEEASNRSSWVEDRDEHDTESVCPFLLFSVLPANSYGVFTVSQPHPKDVSWQGNYCEKGQAGEVTELGMKLQRQLSPSGCRWHLFTPSLLHILM